MLTNIELHALGYSNSRFVSLEEQLTIFLYTSVTGLSIRHVGERFQHSNETISWRVLVHPSLINTDQVLFVFRYFRRMLVIFSSPPPFIQNMCTCR
ncbi:hypothetical protein M405DRAFT_752331 [Rhizopogon salebrosus TDB-379]|nr:hypothetical protein M405DRAFT_752331 [Rhizopogon salebrosus TDB-379]